MKPDKQAFSFVEILIVISILIVMSAVVVTWYSKIQEYSTNSKITTSVQLIDSGLSMYQEEKKISPLPDGNLKYYGNNWEYKHIWFDTDIFWVSGFITQNALDAQYLQKIPLDPRSNQYYAYGVNQSQKNYQVAGVVMHNDAPITLVKGTYHLSGSNPQNIIKEYAGPEFVNDNSNEYFPYNPEERMLIAHIVSYSGSISINGNTYDELTTKKWQLMEWDRIIVSTGGIVKIYYSDGSQSEIWESNLSSDLTFASMRYPNQDNLLTQIRIALNFWKILTKVSQLASKSEFEIYTSNSIASVRGTIFTVIYTGSTSVLVDEWKVEMREILIPTSQEEVFIEKIKNIWIKLGTPLLSPPSNISIEDGKTYLEVLPKERKKWCIVWESTTVNFPSESLADSPKEESTTEIQNPTLLTEKTQLLPPSWNETSNQNSGSVALTWWVLWGALLSTGRNSSATPTTRVKVEGICGDSNGKFLDSNAEITSYCQTGNKANFSENIGWWTWSCNGENGGWSTTCWAIKATYSRIKSDTWTACNKSCWGGTQSLIYYCTKNDDSIVNESKCSAITKPMETKDCNVQTCHGRGCKSCPNGYNEKENNWAWMICWLTNWWKRNERYCNWVYNPSRQEIACERQGSNWFDCDWWDSFDW